MTWCARDRTEGRRMVDPLTTRQRRFVEALELGCSLPEAARRAGVSLRTAYRFLRSTTVQAALRAHEPPPGRDECAQCGWGDWPCELEPACTLVVCPACGRAYPLEVTLRWPSGARWTDIAQPWGWRRRPAAGRACRPDIDRSPGRAA